MAARRPPPPPLAVPIFEMSCHHSCFLHGGRMLGPMPDVARRFDRLDSFRVCSTRVHGVPWPPGLVVTKTDRLKVLCAKIAMHNIDVCQTDLRLFVRSTSSTVDLHPGSRTFQVHLVKVCPHALVYHAPHNCCSNL